MPCEHYKDALTEMAAAGAAPQGELRAHLDECASCRAAFDEEQSLFSAIDSGLHAKANAEVPPPLLQSVRARVHDAALPRGNWLATWYVLAGVAAAVMFLFAVRSGLNTRTEYRPPATVASESSALPATHLAHGPLALERLAKGSVDEFPHVVALQKSAPSIIGDHSMPEVLVPRDQEVLLAQYARQWQSYKPAPRVGGGTEWRTLTPLQPAPIQITQLDVKPLTEDESK